MSIHDGHRQRTKEEFLARPDSFPDHKLLEVLLFYALPRGDTNPTAHVLMERYGSLAGVLDALPDELCKVPGVGMHTVVLLKAAKEMAGRYVAAQNSAEETVNSTKGIVKMLQPYFFGARNERVCLLCLDNKWRSLGVRVIGEGSVNSVEATARSVVEAALSVNATQVILSHNHVAGFALPSEEDKLTTEYLSKVLDSVGVLLRDHIVFANGDAVSMRDSGYPYFHSR